MLMNEKLGKLLSSILSPMHDYYRGGGKRERERERERKEKKKERKKKLFASTYDIHCIMRAFVGLLIHFTHII
jgi:hypothetical protein